MIAMSKSAYLPIVEYSPTKPAIIFVSSCQQCAADDNGSAGLRESTHGAVQVPKLPQAPQKSGRRRVMHKTHV